jgi:ABC-type branched-subunit amino acid transport system substrate-binding protein
MRLRYTFAVAGSLAVTLALAACASSNGTVKAGQGTTITIPVLETLSGPKADLGPLEDKGNNLAQNVIDAGGGICGSRLVLDHVDDADDPVDTAAATNKLVHVNNAKFILGPSSVVSGAALPITTPAKVLTFILGGSTEYDHNTDPYVWRTNVSDGVMAASMASYALSRGWTRAVMVFEEQPAAISVETPLAADYQAHGGHMLATDNIATSQPSYTSVINKIYSLHPQVIFTQVDPPTAAVLFREIASLGDMTVPWVGTNTDASSDFYSAVGSKVASSGLIYAAQSISTTGIGSTTFLSEYQKAYGTTQVATNANFAYDEEMVLAVAMDKVCASGQPLTSDNVIKAIPEVANPPGTPTASYSQAVALIKQGKKIQWQMSGSEGGFNSYHNVFGPFNIFTFANGGGLRSVAYYSADQLRQFSA